MSPPGPANLAPKPVVTHTGDLRDGINFLTSISKDLANHVMMYILQLLVDWKITWLKRRYYLDSGRAPTNHSNGLASQIVSIIPARTMHEFSFESIQPLDVWVLPCTMDEA